jgi:hypothetical protein
MVSMKETLKRIEGAVPRAATMLEERTAMGFSLSYRHGQRGAQKLGGSSAYTKSSIAGATRCRGWSCGRGRHFKNELAVPGIFKTKRRCLMAGLLKEHDFAVESSSLDNVPPP